MAFKFDLPNYPYNVPWFLFDIDNSQLITNELIPGDITDAKSIVYGKLNIPGLDYQPMQYGYGGNNTISFSITIMRRNNTIGNVLLLKQFEMLRHQATGITKITKNKNRTNPKVLFNWGVGTVPLEYYVTKCDFTHKAGFVNQLSNPMATDVSLTLELDGASVLNEAENAFREFSAMAGMVINNYEIVESQITGRSNL